VIPGSRRDALAPQVVALGCHLGSASLTTREVAQLADGDVIMLDRQPGVPLVLTIEGRACASGKAKIVRAVEGALVTIAERPGLIRKV
jgi:flagellar motor switch/type III secretory pathway protein FliN